MSDKNLKILAISQVYFPDTASVSQHLTDLLENLERSGHNVTVISSQRDYENPKIIYPKKQYINGVQINRIKNTGFGKRNKLSRTIDFFTFNVLLLLRLLVIKKERYDIILGLTSPPLLSYIGVIIARLKKIRFIYWTMDLQPELSVVAGYIERDSRPAKLLQYLGDYIFKHATKIITLDNFMYEHVCRRIGQEKRQIDIIPVWPVMNKEYDGKRLSNSFRIQNQFGDKIVIMYSGNHSVMHPLTTLLDAAVKLRNDPRFLFVHIGGGVNLKEVTDCKEKNRLKNIKILPYEPREKIHISLSSADIHVVSLGNGCVGYTHPNKIYGSMFVGRPILYIGPVKSHISNILNRCPGNISVRHGESDLLVQSILDFANTSDESKNCIGDLNRAFVLKNFRPEKLINSMIASIESTYYR